MDKKELYELGKKAKNGDDMSMIKIINTKKGRIKKFSFGDEDQEQYIILKLIEAVKRYEYKK